MPDVTYTPYYPDGWDDSPATDTPIIAAALDTIDAGITAATEQANAGLDAATVEASRAETAEALKAPLASPALTGSPTAPTKTALTDSTDIATTAYADAAVAVEASRAETAEALALQKSASLSDLASPGTARTNLGLGSAATQPSTAFDAAGAAAAAQGAAEAASLPLAAVPDPSALYPGAANMPGPLQPSHVITGFQSGHGWTSSGSGTFSLNDTTAGNFISGTQAATATTAGAGAQCDVRKFAGTSYDTTGQLVRVRFRFDDISHLSELDFYAGSSSLANCWKWSVYVPGLSAYITSGDWITLTLLFSDATVTGSPSRTAVTDWQFQTWDDSAGTVTAHYQSVELVPDGTAVFPNGVVSICFDDSYATPRDNGAWSALDAAGFPATLFSITDRLGLSGYISLADIQARTDRYGWESAGHAWTDADHSATDTGLTAAALDADARAQRAWLLASGIRGGDGYAYPLGNFGLTSDSQNVISVLRRYYSWNRTTSSRMHETWPPADKYRLRAISGISTFSGGVTPSSVETQVTKVAAGGGWLILVFHKIVAGTPAATTECALSDFTAIVSAIQSAGIPVMTIGDVLRHYDPEYVAPAAGDLSGSALAPMVAKINGTAVPAAPSWAQFLVAGDSSHAAWANDWRAEHGLLMATEDPACIQSGVTLSAGVVYLARMPLWYAKTITNLAVLIQTGASPTAAYFGLYDSSGNLQAQTADRHADSAITAGGTEVAPLSSPYAAAAGWWWGAMLFVTTAPGAGRTNNGSSACNVGLTAAAGNLRFASGPGGQAVLPSSISPTAGMSALGSALWMAGD